MALQRFVQFDIDASISGLHPIDWYLDDDGNELGEEIIAEILDEQAMDILMEDSWASLDIAFKIVEKEVDDEV